MKKEREKVIERKIRKKVWERERERENALDVPLLFYLYLPLSLSLSHSLNNLQKKLIKPYIVCGLSGHVPPRPSAKD